MIRKVMAVALVLGALVILFFEFYQFLKKRIVTSDLKLITEKRIGEFLRTSVRADQISIGLLRHISVKGLRIDQTQSKRYPFLLGAKKVIVRYDLLSFWKQNFRFPTEIFLDSPHLTLQAFKSPGELFDLNLLRSDHGIFTRFELEDGEIELPWFRLGEELRLSHIEARVTPKKGDLFHVELHSRLSGIATGMVTAQGELNPSDKKFHLTASLEDVDLSKKAGLPISALSGTIELQNDTLRIVKVRFLMRGIPCEISGTLDDVFKEKPVWKLNVQIREKNISIHSEVEADFKQEIISGAVHFADEKYLFRGKLSSDPQGFRISKVKINETDEVSGDFFYRTGNYHLEFRRAKERAEIDFSLARSSSEFSVQLEHFKLFGFDIVTRATAHLTPEESFWQKGDHILGFHLKTDFLVFQYQPLRDFEAAGRISTSGVDDFLAHWGSVSELRGKISFARPAKADLVLRAGPLTLEELRSFGTHPLPLSLAGIFEGVLEIHGALENPALKGAFTVTKGKAGNFEYDRAVLNFSGQLPYLLLEDSKVSKGKNSFALKGGLDFKLKNFLHGIEVVNSEHIIIWKGLELSREIDELALTSGTVGTAAASAASGMLGTGAGVAKVQAEYQITERTSLHVTAEESKQKDEQYVAAGPKLKF